MSSRWFTEVVHAPDARLRETSGLGEAAIIEIKLIAAMDRAGC